MKVLGLNEYLGKFSTTMEFNNFLERKKAPWRFHCYGAFHCVPGSLWIKSFTGWIFCLATGGSRLPLLFLLLAKKTAFTHNTYEIIIIIFNKGQNHISKSEK